MKARTAAGLASAATSAEETAVGMGEGDGVAAGTTEVGRSGGEAAAMVSLISVRPGLADLRDGAGRGRERLLNTRELGTDTHGRNGQVNASTRCTFTNILDLWKLLC
jgi:hypothetical protein